MGSNWRGLHACTLLVWRQMWADWIVEIWTSVKDYLPEIISAGEAWPLVQRWLQVKRQLWGELAGPATWAPSPHFPSFHSHSSSSLTCREKGAKSQPGSSETATKNVCKTQSSLFSFRFARLIVWDNSQKEDSGRHEDKKEQKRIFCPDRSRQSTSPLRASWDFLSRESWLLWRRKLWTKPSWCNFLSITTLVTSFEPQDILPLPEQRLYSCTPCTMSAGFAIH